MRIALMTFALVTCNPVAAQAAGSASAASCAVVSFYVGQLVEQNPERMTFTTDGEKAVHRTGSGGWYSKKSDDPAPPPARALLVKANRLGRIDGVSKCPGVLNSIKEKAKGRTVTVSTSSISIEGMGRDKEAQLNISISLPVLSVTGTEAIFFTRHEAGLTGGGDYAFYARRSKRGWKIISFKSFTVA